MDDGKVDISKKKRRKNSLWICVWKVVSRSFAEKDGRGKHSKKKMIIAKNEFEQLCYDWLERKSDQVKLSSINKYESILHPHILPFLKVTI